MKTFTEFEQQLASLLNKIGIGPDQLPWVKTNFMNEVKLRFINNCMADANLYNVQHPALDWRAISKLDHLAEIKTQVKAHFKDKEAWKLTRLRELCPDVDVIGILRVGNKRNYWMDDIRQDYTVEQAQQKLEAYLSNKFKIKLSDDLTDNYNLVRTMGRLQEFLKLSLNYDFVFNEKSAWLETDLAEHPDIKFRLFKNFYYFTFKDQKIQKRLVAAYFEFNPVSKYFRY